MIFRLDFSRKEIVCSLLHDPFMTLTTENFFVNANAIDWKLTVSGFS